jgi:para-aminobenzoate synthetase/4-amino-4-deoxychorismate lyase
VRRLALPGAAAPAAVLETMAADRDPVALSGAWLAPSTGSADPSVTILASEPTRRAAGGSDPFTQLDELPAVGENPDGALAGGGWIGWLGYRLGEHTEAAGVLSPPPPAPESPVPSATAARSGAGVDPPRFWLAFYDHLIVHDGERWWFEMLESPARAEALAVAFARWERRLSGPLRLPAPVPGPRLGFIGAGGAGHVDAVAACRERISAGDLYQANLSFRLRGAWDGTPLALLAQALAQTPPRFGAAVGGVVSLSPERFLRRHGTTVWSEPIKGTRARTGELGPDATARDALEHSAKDAAEHVMIVDLMRNDLGRVCEYGSVTASSPRVEPHAGVWQLVSTVTGRLCPEVTQAQLLAATFPPGSVTGAPKLAAMALISELESTRRDAYTGAVGIVSPLAGLDLNVAIRSFELAAGTITLGVGGAVVADSGPEAELAEALLKATGTLGAVSGELTADPRPRARRTAVAAARARWAPLPRALERASRPDPGAGVFTTLLAQNGRPQWLAAHLQRLADSVQRLYGRELDAGLAAQVSAAGAGLARGRIRVHVGPDGGVAVSAAPEAAVVTQNLPALRLAPWRLPGGLGAHKWADRRLLDTLAGAAPATVPLLVDGDGTVLEAAWANVWIVEDGRWTTPPADGRILPGVTRAALLINPGADTREASFDLQRLARADAVFLTASVSGRRRAELASTP